MQYRKGTLVDVLDRVLDRGLFLDADIVLYVADIPLVAARVRAVLSSVETMVEHGFAAETLLVRGRPAGPASANGTGRKGHRE